MRTHNRMQGFTKAITDDFYSAWLLSQVHMAKQARAWARKMEGRS